MAATVMTAEFGTIQYYSSLEEYSMKLVYAVLWTDTKINGKSWKLWHFDLKDNNVLISNMNTN